MFARFSYTWQLMQASWSVLKRDKTLILFPLFSSIACILVVLSFTTPFFFVDLRSWAHSSRHLTQGERIEMYAYIFAFYFVNYFVITFFNVGIISCACLRMIGEEPTFAGGLRVAFQRIHLIAGWALVSATVGLVLKIIESYNKRIGRIIAEVLGAAWTIVTFLVVPVLVVEKKGPIAAFKESVALLQKTWGTQLIGSFSFGLILFMFLIPGFIVIFFATYLMAAVSIPLGLLLIGLVVAYILALALVQSTLHSIFQAAVYMYTQGVPDETHSFSMQLLRDSMYERQ
jgi:Family of unknown function (DUF6159)